LVAADGGPLGVVVGAGAGAVVDATLRVDGGRAADRFAALEQADASNSKPTNAAIFSVPRLILASWCTITAGPQFARSTRRVILPREAIPFA
jgi:hypothetical protein